MRKRFLAVLCGLVCASLFVLSAEATVYRKSGMHICGTGTWAYRTAETPNKANVWAGRLSGFNPYIVDAVRGAAGDIVWWRPYWNPGMGLENFKALFAQPMILTGRAHIRIYPAAVGADSSWIDLAASTDSLYSKPLKGPIDSLMIRWTETGYGFVEGY